MNIQEAIVHQFKKEKFKPSSVLPRLMANDVDDIMRDLIGNVRNIFNRTVSRGYGQFEDDTTAYPFSLALENYTTSKKNIADFTKEMLSTYKKGLDSASGSTGGYLFFVSYQEGSDDFLLVFTLKLKPGQGIDEITLELNETIVFDVSQLHEAARINITSWKSNGKNYVTFIKRKGDNEKSSTEYFRLFLGVTELNESLAMTRLLINTITQYCKDKNFDPDHTKLIRQRVHSYCIECKKENKRISLAALSMKFDDQKPTLFTDYLDQKNITLNDDFEPNSKAYRVLNRYTIKTSKLTLDFEQSILGNQVIYDDKNKQIIINEIPLELQERLRETISTEKNELT